MASPDRKKWKTRLGRLASLANKWLVYTLRPWSASLYKWKVHQFTQGDESVFNSLRVMCNALDSKQESTHFVAMDTKVQVCAH